MKRVHAERKKTKKTYTNKYPIGAREFRFFYMIGWILAYWIRHGINPAILSRLNTGLENGGSCTSAKSEIYRYFTKGNPTARKHFATCINIPHDTSWENARESLKTFKDKKIVLKPDNGSRSIGVRTMSTDIGKKSLLKARGKTDYIAQEYISYKHELGIFYYKYPTWKHGKILGIADRKFDNIVDPKNKDQYTDRSDLITPQVTETFNKIVGNKEIYYCRFDIKAKDLEQFKKGRGFKIIEVNAGPDAVSLHALDSRYGVKKKLQMSTEDLKHAFNISRYNAKRRYGNKASMGLIRYILFMVRNEPSLQCLRFRVRNIKNEA